MTREDAFEIWLPIIKMGVKSMPECSEALDMAIKALKQEPCDDAISREAVIDIIEDVCPIYGNDYRYILRDKVNELPPVTAEKVGQWIDIQYFKADDTYYRPKCPFCSIEPKEYSNYCPNCGAKMEVEE